MSIRGIAAIIFVALASCSQPETVKTEFSTEVSPNTLRTEAFGITVVKPDGWYSLDEQLQKALAEEGGKIVSQDNKALAGVIERSKPRSSQLFGVFKFEPGAAVESNPSVVAMAENVSLAPGVKTGADYFFHFKKLAAQASINYELDDNIIQVELGGRKFDKMNLKLTANGKSISQSYYAARDGDHVILFVQSYLTQEEEAETGAIISSIAFDSKE